MTVTTVPITCDIGLADDSEFITARLDFILSGPDYDAASNDAIPAHVVSVDLDANGEGVANLWPVDLGVKNTKYSVTVVGSFTSNGTTKATSFSLGNIRPQSGTTPTLADLLAQESGGVIVGSTIYATIADAVAAAVASAVAADVSANNATTAALAAGAEIVTSLPDPIPANGEIVILQDATGSQVYEVVGGAWVPKGWLTSPQFGTIAIMAAAARFADSDLVTVRSGFNGEPGTFRYDAGSALAADGSLVVDAVGMGVGQLVDTRKTLATVADLLTGDPRGYETYTAGDVVNAGGFRYEVVSSGADLTTLGGVGLKVLPNAGGEYPAAAFGVTASNLSNINAAVAASASGGGWLSFDGGTYALGATQLSIVSSNTRIKGIKGETKFTAAETNPFQFAHTTAIGNIHFKDFEIDVSGVVAAFKDAAIQDATEQAINGLVMEGVTITADTDNMSAVFFGDSETAVMTDFTVRDCKFTAAGKYTYGFALRKQCIGFHYENNECTLSDVGSYNNLALYADTQQFTVHGNRFFGGGHSPIAASPAQYGFITNNYMKNDLFFQLANEGGIEAEWKDGHQGADTSHDIVISGNVVEGNYQWGIFTTARDAGPNAAGVVEPYNITITDNIIIDPMNTGVYVRDGNKIRVGGNQITRDAQIGTVGISVNLSPSYSPNEIQIINNIINDQDGEGISVGRFGDDCVVSGNIIRNSDKAGILISDAGNRLRVDGNTVFNSGLDAATANDGIQIVSADDHLSVCHNLVQRTSRNGIRVDTALENARIDSNTVEDVGNVFAGSDGIRLITLGRGWSALGNTINDTPRYGIRLEATLADGGRVNGNFVYTTAASAAISIACDNSLITDNVVDCGAPAQIANGGTGNTVADNVEL
jgi:hypothetical protein